jgi:YD repeat-containing protein
LTGKTLPDGSLNESRSYDAAGNLVSLKHFNGKTTTYTYDSLNRLLTRVPDATLSEPTVTFTYTATGKRATMADGSGTTTYFYDSLDRLETKDTPEGTLSYTYDAGGHLASMSSSHTNGVSASYTYDSLNRLSTVVDGRLASGANTTTYTYDSANNLATATLPNGVESTLTYDSLNRVTSLESAVSGYGYYFDATGKRTEAVELSGRTINWSWSARPFMYQFA